MNGKSACGALGDSEAISSGPTCAARGAAFSAGPIDGVMALFALVLGYFFWRWVEGSAAGWGTAAFTLAYLCSVLTYLRFKGVRISRESWFWFAVTLVTGLSFALWDANSLAPLKTMFLFLAAVYWVMSATSTQLFGRTGDYLLLDGVNAVFVIPLANFLKQFQALSGLLVARQSRAGKVLAVALGAALALVVAAVVTPMLLSADSGGFSGLVDSLARRFSPEWTEVLDFLLRCVLAVPTGAYIFGLVSGCAAGCVPGVRTREKAVMAAASVRIVHLATVLTALGLTCALYAVFILSQLPYFFSAFSGKIPPGWLSYAEYARRGFFDLCGIAFINLVLLAASNLLCRVTRAASAALRALNAALSLATLVLIATALAKLALYVREYGLTVQRILPSVFMVFLTVVFLAVIALQRVEFSAFRLAAVAGVALLAAVCLADPDTLTVRYNTARYLAGTLSDYDVGVLYRSGPAGVPAAAQVYVATADDSLKQELRTYLEIQRGRLNQRKGAFRDTLQDALARKSLGALDLTAPPKTN